MKIFESHVNAQQRVPLSEDDSNNIVDMMTHSMDSSQCFPLPPIISQWALDAVAMLAGMEDIMGPTTWIYAQKGQYAYGYC